MITATRFQQSLMSAAVVSMLGVACAPRLRDYTQLNVQADIPSDQSEEAAAQSLIETQQIIENRLLDRGIEDAEITTEPPNTIVVRLPQTIAADDIASGLVSTGRLTFRSQKPDTEDKLAEVIETKQRLLVEQNTLLQTGKQAEADALKPQIDQVRTDILNLFGEPELTEATLRDAQAVQNTGFNVWDVKLWFDSEGANQFAQQTKKIAGTGRAIGIFLDDVLLSTPVVAIEYAETGILGGEAVITGNFTKEAAEAIELQLKSGALPTGLELVSIVSSDELDSEELDEQEAVEEASSTESQNL